MPTITTADGTEIFTKTGDRGSRSYSVTGGSCRVMTGTLKTYHGFPHGMPTAQAATINADLLAWLQA